MRIQRHRGGYCGGPHYPTNCWWCMNEGDTYAEARPHGTVYVMYEDGEIHALHEKPCLDLYLLMQVGRELRQ